MSPEAMNPLAFQANMFIVGARAEFASVARSARRVRIALRAYATTQADNLALRLKMLKRLIAYGNLALTGLYAATMVHDAPVRALRPVARAIEPLPLSIEAHWQRATAVLRTAIERFQRIESLQAAAARQIDAADYALARLIHDLRPAMALPTDVTGLRAILAEAERTTHRSAPMAALAA